MNNNHYRKSLYLGIYLALAVIFSKYYSGFLSDVLSVITALSVLPIFVILLVLRIKSRKSFLYWLDVIFIFLAVVLVGYCSYLFPGGVSSDAFEVSINEQLMLVEIQKWQILFVASILIAGVISVCYLLYDIRQRIFETTTSTT